MMNIINLVFFFFLKKIALRVEGMRRTGEGDTQEEDRGWK